jgi:hypothetical protein
MLKYLFYMEPWTKRDFLAAFPECEGASTSRATL